MNNSRKLPARSRLAIHWDLDERTVFLNHGSYGACPRIVLEHQSDLRRQLESQPVDFLQRQTPILLQAAKDTLQSFLKCSTGQTIFVPNATFGVNAILANFPFDSSDEILVTNHGYRACTNAAREIGRKRGFAIRSIEIPYPIHDPGEVTARVLSALSPSTRLVLIDHITSPTGLVFPVPEIVRELNQRGIESLIDGAHAPGSIPVNLKEISASFYVGNCHKWLSAPKGSGFIHFREDWCERFEAPIYGHATSLAKSPRELLNLSFDWMGTYDPTPHLCLPSSLSFWQKALPGGIQEAMSINHSQTTSSLHRLCQALEVDTPTSDAMLSSMATIILPQAFSKKFVREDTLYDLLREEWSIEIPVIPLTSGRLGIRFSAQIYNSSQEYEYLEAALLNILARL